MTKKSKMTLALASMLGITAGATAVSGFAWFTTTKSATVDITNIGVYSKSSGLDVQLKQAGTLIGVTDNASTKGDINLVGAVGAQKTEAITSDGTKTVTLSQYPSDEPTMVKVGETNVTSTTTWTEGTKTLTLADTPTQGDIITVTYAPYAALTDVSSVNGKDIYKPVWTASGEGRYATAITDQTDNAVVEKGYIQFTMTLKASGASDLDVFLNSPSITAASNGTADTAAAAITRVALLEGNTTKLVLQNAIGSPNNKGIDSSFASTMNCRLDGATGQANDGWDLSLLSATVSGDVFAVPQQASKSTMSAAPDISTNANKALNNYVTTVAAGDETDITVTIWLEGTNGIDAYTQNAGGAFTSSPENGMISVSLPLIAF